MFRTACLLTVCASSAWARDTRPPILLVQRLVDGGPLCVGCAADAVELTASSDANACGGGGIVYTLELEVVEATSTFSSAPTLQSAGMTKPPCTQQQYGWTRVTGLTPGKSYKWQARESASSGSTDVWVAFANGQASFVIGPVDAGVADAGGKDAGVADAGVADAGVADVADAGVADAGVADAGVADAGVADAGATDAGVADAGVAEPTYTVGCRVSPGPQFLAAMLLIASLVKRRRRDCCS